MEALAPAAPAPTTAELISVCEKPISDVRTDADDTVNQDRVYILRKNFNNYLYYRDLQNSAGQLISSIENMTSMGGPQIGYQDDGDVQGLNDYTQKHYTGNWRKFVAVIGNRMPNAIAVPNNPGDEESVRATKSANPASIYIRDKCNLEGQHLDQAGRIFSYGTCFWHIDWEEDGDKNGYQEIPNEQMQPQALGNAGFQCQCGGYAPSDNAEPTEAPSCPDCQQPMSMDNFQSPTMVDQKKAVGPPKRVPKGALSVMLHDSNEIAVPLDATCIDDCDWLRWEREIPKGRLFRKYGDKLREANLEDQGFENPAQLWGTWVRSSMASPIGLVRFIKNNWTCCDEWWTPNHIELIEDKEARQMLQQNFPDGVRLIYVKGKLMDMKAEKLSEHWHDCRPEPAPRIMTDALGDEWTQTTDIANNTMNQMEENVSRSNLPLFVNANKFDMDAWGNRFNKPGDTFPMIPRAGKSLGDEMFQPSPMQFSEQIPAFRANVIEDTKNNTGMIDAIFGGGEPDPTARQTLLKTNQALMQLGTYWTQIRKCLEQVLLKSCKLLSQYQEGIVAFSKKNQFGRFDQLSFVAEDLRSDGYHFEADEAIPINWGQQRDQLMWMLSQAEQNPKVLEMLGVNDPFNVFEIKQLLGIPGMRTPLFDAREKGMDVIAQLLKAKPAPGPVDPTTGAPGPQQPSITPDWEDPNQFMADMCKAYLLDNADLKESNPDGYSNVQLYGTAQFNLAKPPAQAPPAKTTVALSAKPADIGPQATQAILLKEGLLAPGTPVAAQPPPLDPNKSVPPPLDPNKSVSPPLDPNKAPLLPTAPAPIAPPPAGPIQ